MSEWISVEDQLPVHGTMVICINSENYDDADVWSEIWDENEPIGSTKFWILFPEIPKEIVK